MVCEMRIGLIVIKCDHWQKLSKESISAHAYWTPFSLLAYLEGHTLVATDKWRWMYRFSLYRFFLDQCLIFSFTNLCSKPGHVHINVRVKLGRYGKSALNGQLWTT